MLYQNAWRTGTGLLTECKVTLARAEANQKNEVIDTAKDFVIGGLAVWVAARGTNCSSQ